MSRIAFQVFVACFSGALIGGFIALDLFPDAWWSLPLGMIVGGFVGYLAINLKEVKAAIPRAWNKAKGWRPSEELKLFIKTEFLGVFTFLVLTVSAALAILLIPVVYYQSFSAPLHMTQEDKNSMLALFILSELIPVILWLGLSFEAFGNFCDSERKELLKTRNYVRKLLRWVNPLTLFFYFPLRGILYEFPRIAFKIIKACPKIAKGGVAFMKMVFAFLKHFFILIHSKLRVLCAVDAAIGVIIGYLLENVLLGGVVGGFFGVLNYYLISIRLLKLVPTTK